MMLPDVCLSDVWRLSCTSGRRAALQPAGWMACIGWSGPARPAWLKAAAARFRCRPGRGHRGGRPPIVCLCWEWDTFHGKSCSLLYLSSVIVQITYMYPMSQKIRHSTLAH